MAVFAAIINKLSRGRITPNTVTIFGFLAHIPIALLIVDDRLILAAILLVIFGLLDAVDGELARLQGKSSPAGMLLDASTDRFKEVILYTGTAYYLSRAGQADWAFIAVIACGASLCVSYIKAKGESAIATSGKKLNHAELNRLFSDGLASFDVRIFLLVIGLLTDRILVAICIIAVLSTYTAIFRLVSISKALKS